MLLDVDLPSVGLG
jgi:exodeoxyribonuclease V alpha subunit